MYTVHAEYTSVHNIQNRVHSMYFKHSLLHSVTVNYIYVCICLLYTEREHNDIIYVCIKYTFSYIKYVYI